MSVREEVKKLLEANRDKSLSGQEIAEQIGVTRAAVWKAVNTLKQEGYRIEAVNNRGYRLLEESDILSPEGIKLELDEKYRNYKIDVYKTIDSTNQEVKRQALEGAGQGLVVLAEQQTMGKGRRGRSFYSPAGTGIYMSVLFRPSPEQSKDVVLVTTAASVAICRAIRKVLNEEPQIKWVNDVYFRGKKVCGILTEAVSDFESGQIDTVVVGIGINYHVPEDGFPEEIRGIAGSVCTDENMIPRNSLVAAVLNELFAIYEKLSEREYMEDYRRWSNVIGKDVRFTSGDGWMDAKALDIDDNGGLLVQLDNGEKKTLRTGEITLRVY
ncbi:MAG: biotin--[acetyl-CoA-carboxylase] ligase [Eubacterium sp.]|nr:biotin--[acetyl-CoA-carboxylase] ligase [Eubacterium sp.]